MSPSFFSPWMNLAIAQATLGASQGEIPVGVVLVNSQNNYLLFEGHNLVETSQNPLAHAEMLAIHAACTLLQTPVLSECDLYVTLEPCPMCAQALSFARIRRIIFGAFNPKGGGIDHGPQIFHPSFSVFKPEIIGGVQENACRTLLQDFFEKIRDKKDAEILF